MPPPGVTIRPAVTADLAPLAAVMARAFADDPVFAWMLPGRHDRSRRLQVLFSTTLRREARGVALVEVALAAHPRAPHWYLHYVGVDPELQRRGVGGELAASQLRRCDAEGSSAYLESSNPANLPLYRRLGFEPAGSLVLPAGAPAVATMWRRPADRAPGSRS